MILGDNSATAREIPRREAGLTAVESALPVI
jgi:hypothetical protein